MTFSAARGSIKRTMNHGKVIIIGAGPGGPDLLTIKAARLLGQADVVLYDRLISLRILRLAREGAELIYVGKAPSEHALPQEKINEMLIAKARQGKLVARLKGGDPFVFGRGGEEILALRKAGIDFEVVPGITAASALGAYAGIPLTHRALATSVAIATGHEDPEKEGEQVDWAALANAADTIGIYMGVRRLGAITEKLLSAGLPPETPAAIVANAASPEQRTIVSTLGKIAQTAEAENIHPPALAIIGRVVELRDGLNWYERLPLFGRTVLVTRAAAQAADFSDILEEYGASPLEIPVIKIGPPKDTTDMDYGIENLGRFDWIIFTSVNGVDYFMQRLREMGRDARSLYRVRICCIGPATAARVEKYFLRVDCMPDKFVSKEIVRAMIKLGSLKDKNVLLPRADIAPPDLTENLRGARACVTEATVYRTEAADFDGEALLARLRAGEIDAVTLASASAVRCLSDGLGRDNLIAVAHKTIFAAIGPVTAQTAKEAGLPVAVVAQEHTISGLARALAGHFDIS